MPMLIGNLGFTESEQELFLRRTAMIYASNLEMAQRKAEKKVK